MSLTALLVMKIGYVIPVAIFATVLLSIGSGLYSLLGPGSPTGYWVGFQIIAGSGSGASLQLVCYSIRNLIHVAITNRCTAT